MQLVIQVISFQSHSLTNLIVNDKKLKDYDFYVVEKKKVVRLHGWANLHSVGANRDGPLTLRAGLPNKLCNQLLFKDFFY